MSSSEQKKCNQCLSLFSHDKKPLRMPVCRHNICEQCLQQIKESKIDVLQCEFCDAAPTKISKWKFEFNRLIMNKFKDQKKKCVENSSETSVSINASVNKTEHQDLVECDGNQFLLTEDTPDRKKLKEVKKEDTEICPEHDKPFEIVCTTDLKMICPHCAIFGNHKDHCFKTLKQFNRDYEQRQEKLQMIKQQKYMNDKKLKNMKAKQNIENLIDNRKTNLRKQITTIFQKLIRDIQELEVKICEDLNKAYSGVYKDVMAMFDQQAKITVDYQKWESECQNCLQSANQHKVINEKIKLLYGPLTKIGQGQDLVDKLDKKLDLQTKKINSMINSVYIDYKDGIDFSKFVKITRKQDDPKKQNIVQSIQKLSLPIGKHVLQDIDFGQNSFLADYQKEQLSLLLDGQPKRVSTKSVMSKRSPLSKTTSQKFRSPNKKNQMNMTNQSMMNRCKSNTEVKINELMQNTSSPNILQTSLIKIQIRDLKTIVADFLKHDLKQVLDLSRCDLTDQTVVTTLRDIRRHRKIRGLKLCQNYITDKGFESMMQLLGSTSNLNISYNKLTEQSLSMMIKNRDKISPLRIVNMSFNNLNDKKSKTRIDALKKMGIIVNV